MNPKKRPHASACLADSYYAEATLLSEVRVPAFLGSLHLVHFDDV